MNLEGTIGCYRVYLDQSLDLPPRSEVLTVGRIQGNANAPMVNLGVGIIEPADQFTKSNRGLVTRTLTDGKEKVPVRIPNLKTMVKGCKGAPCWLNIALLAIYMKTLYAWSVVLTRSQSI